MTIEFEVRVNGLDVLIEKYRRADKKAEMGLKRAVRRSLEHLRKKVAEYSGKVVKPMRYASFKQMVYVLAAIRKGEIKAPYPRTGTLGRRWAVKVEEQAGDVVGILGNITPYAPHVQDKEAQAGYHRGNWQTAQDVVEEERGTVVDFFYEEIRGLLD